MIEEKRTVEEFIQDLEKFSYDGDAVDANVDTLLEAVTYALDGKLSYETCISKNTQHKRIVIEYDYAKKD